MFSRSKKSFCYANHEIKREDHFMREDFYKTTCSSKLFRVTKFHFNTYEQKRMYMYCWLKNSSFLQVMVSTFLRKEVKMACVFGFHLGTRIFTSAKTNLTKLMFLNSTPLHLNLFLEKSIPQWNKKFSKHHSYMHFPCNVFFISLNKPV